MAHRKHRIRQPAVLAWLRLVRVFQKIDTSSERFFRLHGLNTAHFDVVARVGAVNELTQQELAAALLVTKGNISQLLSKLEQAGIVRRRHVGRTNYVSLTERGTELFQVLVPQQESLIADLLAPLSDDEQRELLRLLRKLDHALDP